MPDGLFDVLSWALRWHVCIAIFFAAIPAVAKNDASNIYICAATAADSLVASDQDLSFGQDSTKSQDLHPPSELQAADVDGEPPVKYWGNSYSNKFHRPSCVFAKAMNARHVVFFHFRREAVAAGEVPCRYCLPPIVKRVQCKILPKAELAGGQAGTNNVKAGDQNTDR
ncbi:MAG TPA: hypothetical protein V6C97_07145 [Oculatellaceae cyanobacterium]